PGHGHLAGAVGPEGDLEHVRQRSGVQSAREVAPGSQYGSFAGSQFGPLPRAQAKSLRSTLWRSVGSKYGWAHRSVVDRNEPADSAAARLVAGGVLVAPVDPCLASGLSDTLFRKWK